jgi:hypothetical protein
MRYRFGQETFSGYCVLCGAFKGQRSLVRGAVCINLLTLVGNPLATAIPLPAR